MAPYRLDKKTTSSPSHSALIGLLIAVILLFWDIGNPLAPRQGTESLYVQISKEMFEAGSFLTPLYRGEAHWSKPPLQYWLPMPLYGLFGGFSLAIARLSMGLISVATFFAVFMFLRRQNQRVDLLTSGAIFFASFGVMKFSRIFMMEIPLAFFPLIGALGFYDYLQSKSKWSFALAVISFGLGGMVKGPVSLAMGFASLGTFCLYEFVFHRRNILMPTLMIITSATLFSSIWYVACYLEYGQEFIDYFFLRENLGKFGQKKSMSGLKIIQGLIIYTFPWLHLITHRPMRFFGDWKSSPFKTYLLIHFIVFFVIWFIPSQKSHHYAMPAFAFWIVLLLLKKRDSFGKKHLVYQILFYLQVFLLLALSSLCVYFSANLSQLALGLTPLVLICLCLRFKNKEYLLGLSFLFLFSVGISRFYLPVIPNEHVEKVMQNSQINLFLNDRRPFFLEQRLNRKVYLLSEKSPSLGDLILTPKRRKLPTANISELHRWNKWKRKVSFEEFMTAIKTRRLDSLKSEYILFKVK